MLGIGLAISPSFLDNWANKPSPLPCRLVAQGYIPRILPLLAGAPKALKLTTYNLNVHLQPLKEVLVIIPKQPSVVSSSYPSPNTAVIVSTSKPVTVGNSITCTSKTVTVNNITLNVEPTSVGLVSSVRTVSVIPTIARKSLVTSVEALCVQIEPTVKSCVVTGYLPTVIGATTSMLFIPTPIWVF